MTRNLRVVDKQVLIALLMLCPKDNPVPVQFPQIYWKLRKTVPSGLASQSTMYAVLREFQRRGWVSITEGWTSGSGSWFPPNRSWDYRLLSRGRRVVEKLLKDDWFTAFQAKEIGYRAQPELPKEQRSTPESSIETVAAARAKPDASISLAEGKP